jgi:uncharacterized protein YegL
MKNKRTYYQLILDRSGSMSSCIEETVAGVNSQIRRIKELAARYPEQEIVTSLCVFNQKPMLVRDRVRVNDLNEVSFTEYMPNGMTALYDAIGVSVSQLNKIVAKEVERDEASVVVVIFTDGYENASIHYNHQKVSSIIKDLELSGKWSFSYVGATFDAVNIAVQLNIKANNAVRYDVKDSVRQFDYVSDRMENYMHLKKNGIIHNGFLDNENPDH